MRRVMITGGNFRVTEIRDGSVTRRVRARGVQSSGVSLGASVTPDGRFALLDGVGGGVRIVDCEVSESRRREKEVDGRVIEISVLRTAAATCAAFASDSAVKRCGRVVCGRSIFLLAVGGDDGSLTLLEQVYA